MMSGRKLIMTPTNEERPLCPFTTISTREVTGSIPARWRTSMIDEPLSLREVSVSPEAV